MHLSCADSSDLLFGDATFAKAVAVHTLHFWPDPVRQRPELRTGLAPWCPPGARVPAEGQRGELGSPEAVYRLDARRDVEHMLARAGFERVRVEALSSAFMLARAE